MRRFLSFLFGNSKTATRQGMVKIQSVGADSIGVENLFNKWSLDNPTFRVTGFDVVRGRDASNQQVETLYILFDYE